MYHVQETRGGIHQKQRNLGQKMFFRRFWSRIPRSANELPETELVGRGVKETLRRVEGLVCVVE